MGSGLTANRLENQPNSFDVPHNPNPYLVFVSCSLVMAFNLMDITANVASTTTGGALMNVQAPDGEKTALEFGHVSS
jgi:hypothetical protein